MLSGIFWKVMEQIGINKINKYNMQIIPETQVMFTSGSTVTASQGVGLVIVNPASALSAMTINFPPNPDDRDMFMLQFGGSILSGSVVVLLTLSGGATGILGTLPTTANSGQCMTFIYNIKTNKWYRIS